MITTFHADTGYHVNQFHGRTVPGHIRITFCQQSQRICKITAEAYALDTMKPLESRKMTPKPPASGFPK